MSNATKCDRCGGYFEQGGRSVRQGFGANMVEFDLCPDCAEAFDAWMEYHPVTGAPERVTNDGEMLHDTREQLEADVQKFAQVYYADHLLVHDKVIELLDRQAAITERDMLDEMQHVFVPDPADITKRDKRIAELEAERDEMAQRIQTLEREIATLKEHRAANMEKLHELTDECAELRKYRDEWKGLAEKYRADSIAAQEAAAEMAQRIQTLELEIAKRDKGIERLKRRRGELTEQLGAMADRMAKDGR